MTAVASQRQPTRARRPWPVMAAIAAAWALAVVAQATGTAGGLHHDTLIGSGPPLWLALPLFLVAWQAMFAAMMLPSSLPLIRLFHVASQGQHQSAASEQHSWPATQRSGRCSERPHSSPT